MKKYRLYFLKSNPKNDEDGIDFIFYFSKFLVTKLKKIPVNLQESHASEIETKPPELVIEETLY